MIGMHCPSFWSCRGEDQTGAWRGQSSWAASGQRSGRASHRGLGPLLPSVAAGQHGQCGPGPRGAPGPSAWLSPEGPLPVWAPSAPPASLSAGLCARPVLTQSPSASSFLGGSAALTCALSSKHGTYFIRWDQQSPGQAPRDLMKLTRDGQVTRGHGTPDRFSGSSSGAERYLTISSLQSDDEADYICGVSYSDGGQSGYHSDSDKGEVRHKPPSRALCPRAPG